MESLNTEGVTFKKPSRGPSSSGKRKYDDSDSSTFATQDVNVDILRTFEEPALTIPRRMELYRENLELLKNYFKNSQEKCNLELSEKLNEFVSTSFQLVDKDSNVLPIGVLESGLSVGENSSLFDFIEQKIKSFTHKSNQKVYICRAQSGTSPSTKAVFQKICRQIVTEQQETVNDDEIASDSQAGRKERHFSLYDVKSFLPSIKSMYKIMILVEDVDYFSNIIVSQLLTLMGCSQLPVIFIFGVSHGHFISNLIPTHSSANFVLNKFHSISAKNRLNEFMRRFCLRSHFLTSKSALCTFEKLETNDSTELVQWFETFIQDSQSSASDTPNKRQKTKTSVKTNELVSCTDQIRSWYFTLRFLCFVNFRLPNQPLGDDYTRTYVSCYEGFSTSAESDENNPFHRFMRELNSLSKPDVKDLLEDCANYVSKNNQPVSEVGSHILIKLDKLLQEISEDKKQPIVNHEDEAKGKSIRLKKRTRDIKELQQTLMEIKRQNEGTTLIHVIKKNLIDFFRNLMKKYLPPMSSLKYSDIFVFSDLSQLVSTLFPANFLQLGEDLVNPGYFLQCSCCSSLESSSICDSLPDVSIIHKLISEHTTKKLDLNIMYHAFISIVQTTGRRGKASTNATASYLIRFRRAVGELQHMGFIKRSKSKPDEISRLTWW
ncbi:unnamed protein product [Orchesella dallaii]|uniref:Origin recognition complex subunit 3 n=1 Tax=Orchesella dallaii TaxID=48710 RepID=A0ABP1QVF1_9HEXA